MFCFENVLVVTEVVQAAIGALGREMLVGGGNLIFHRGVLDYI